MKGKALVHLIWANREELAEYIMQKVDHVRMNIKRIHDPQQKRGQKRKQLLTVSEKKDFNKFSYYNIQGEET